MNSMSGRHGLCSQPHTTYYILLLISWGHVFSLIIMSFQILSPSSAHSPHLCFPAHLHTWLQSFIPALLCLCHSCLSCLVPGFWIFACSLGFVCLIVCLPVFDPCLFLTPIKYLWTLKYLLVVVLLGSLPSEPLHLYYILPSYTLHTKRPDSKQTVYTVVNYTITHNAFGSYLS